MAQRSFKTDESFLEKLAIGAIGTQKVIEDLTNQGHTPVELERGSTGYKIWKTIKIKRVRVPDILCINSGIRIESVADNNVQYIKIVDLRKALSDNKVIQEKPKGAQEGFESRLTWPSSVASSDGQVINISSRIKFKRSSDSRTISLALTKKGIELTPCVVEGEKIYRHQILASVTLVLREVPTREIDPQNYYQNLLTSASISERYGAAKAYSFLKGQFDTNPLIERINDDAEHIR
jgi:hypothetical protein